MGKILSLQKISLKNHPEIQEDMIQKYIFDNPKVLGLGELIPIQREKVQPSGGRLDILMGSADNESRYEIEIQLGATDPSHIIRTLEYWDLERKRYPQYDHCAVIIAEEITGRFMNVINLFNGAIPLIALQVSAYKLGEDISITFTKVIDRITYGSDEEEKYEATDRAYWEKRSTKKLMDDVDLIFDDLQQYVKGYELKYNKYYIGLAKNGIANNFISFKPVKTYMYISFRAKEDEEFSSSFEEAGLEATYWTKSRTCQVKINGYEDYKRNEALFSKCVEAAMDYFNLNEM